MLVAEVDLWGLITSAANKDLPNSQQCKELKEMCAKAHGFVSELTLKVNEYGTWEVRLFQHDGDNAVTLAVSPNGRVNCERQRSDCDLTEHRSVSF